ncbi:MAG: SDR family NAD(P)-dependent oxidoreductase [Myxococcales bacterium]|nr:SDR family NAD(P)-dependent oxidoreductase [Myxococcales bacterium]
MKVALVTGGAKRIGRALVEGLAADGWFVYVHCFRSREAAAAVVAGLPQGGAVVQADLAAPDLAEQVYAQIGAGPVPTLLVNNASRFEFDAAPAATAASLDAHFQVNARAPILLAQALARHLPDGVDGHVVNLLDSKLEAPDPDYFAYTVSKFALDGATRLLARALAPRVRVNAIAPGAVLTGPELSPEGLARTAELVPLRRVPAVDELVTALRYLIQSPSLTGVVLPVDAGRRLAGLTRDVAFLTT